MEASTERSLMSADEIRAHWATQASHGLDPASSWTDWRAIELEIATISEHLDSGSYLLDAGCGTGYSSARYASVPAVRVLGVDYIEKMIDHALERRSRLPKEISERLDFRLGDVRRLELDSASFDCVVATRVLINLGDRDEQRRGLRELGRVLRPGGLLLLSEATMQGLDRLNALRGEWSLPPIPVPPFNLYIDESRLQDQAGSDLALRGVANFASSYFVVTRVLKPLVASISAASIDVADPNAELNRWAAQLPAAGDYGTQKLFVFRKSQ
jgi:SAM-dependent methyltransferase